MNGTSFSLVCTLPDAYVKRIFRAKDWGGGGSSNAVVSLIFCPCLPGPSLPPALNDELYIYLDYVMSGTMGQFVFLLLILITFLFLLIEFLNV